ncbi:hypothetical protein Z945_3356 [Sulfitobacter noctilucae]|uniref:hypothetical protein n=1 Tax=Sulfitobacter noctilucae TaxID=1342302 RepID=UPI000A99AFB3|nr:hypothetical protein [Sulfitobacter noctilucae]KIN70892.1 hypothetical protein Z945_3356 [Sulfitobacter noctilucae]
MFIKICSIAIAIATAVSLPAMANAGGGAKHHHHGAYGPTGHQIVVSCFRGPWKEVIWDRPNAVFIDSLVSVGYDFSTAQAIGERVCRDQRLVGNPAALKTTMERIWYDRASHRKHNY